MAELTIAEIIDRLITTSMKCYAAQDELMKINANTADLHDLKHLAEIAQRAQKTNKKRAYYMQELDTAIKKAIEAGTADVIDGSKTY